MYRDGHRHECHSSCLSASSMEVNLEKWSVRITADGHQTVESGSPYWDSVFSSAMEPARPGTLPISRVSSIPIHMMWVLVWLMCEVDKFLGPAAGLAYMVAESRCIESICVDMMVWSRHDFCDFARMIISAGYIPCDCMISLCWKHPLTGKEQTSVPEHGSTCGSQMLSANATLYFPFAASETLPTLLTKSSNYWTSNVRSFVIGR